MNLKKYLHYNKSLEKPILLKRFKSQTMNLSNNFIAHLFLIVLVFVFCFNFFKTEALAQNSSEFIQAQGKNLIYKNTQIVLKGTNFDNVPALGASIGSGNIDDIIFTEIDYQRVSAAGANHIRFGMSFNWYQDNQSQFFQVLDQHIAWAKSHDLWIILNLFTTPGDCYEGYSEVCDIWVDTNEQTELQNFWVAIANRYKNEPAVAGFGLLNEPNPQTTEFCGTWFDIAGNIRNAIYAIAPNQLVFVATCADPANNLLYNDPPVGTNIVYEVHDYSPLAMTHNFSSPTLTYPGPAQDWFATCTYNKAAFTGVVASGDPVGCTSQLLSTRDRYGITWANTNNLPIYIGEWGTTSKLNGYAQFMQDKAELYRDWGVNHAHYTWRHETIVTGGTYQWGIYSAASNTLDDPAKLTALQISWQNAINPDFSTSSNPTVTNTVSPTITPSVLPNTNSIFNNFGLVSGGALTLAIGIGVLVFRRKRKSDLFDNF
jgi:LPXTG-motif cell wall-anchored protein